MSFIDSGLGDNRYPSTVIASSGYSSARVGSGTATTSIETSPLSSEHYSTPTAFEIANNLVAPKASTFGEDHDLRCKTTRRKHHQLDHNRSQHYSTNSSRRRREKQTKESREKIRYNHQQSSSKGKHRSQGNHSHYNLSQRLAALTWRMNPLDSLSDYTLEVISIDDEEAIRKRNANKHRTKRSRRRDKWMVEGLYLDISDSEGSGCLRDGSNDDQENDQERKEGSEGTFSFGDGTYASRNSLTPGSTYIAADSAQKSFAPDHPARHEYNVHKVNLAVGPRSCDYFSRLFRKSASKNQLHNHHSIELPQSTISAIPAMLDFFYSSDESEPVHATTDTAVQLRYLATVFGNRPLFDSATEFLQQDLTIETAITYLNYADLYRQKKLAEVCVRLCAEEFEQLKIRWLAKLSPQLMEQILYSKYFKCSCDQVICTKIASYCRCHQKAIDGNMLLSLTDVRVMPEICPEEALYFIKYMVALGLDLAGEHHSCKERNLYERCIDAAPSVVRSVINSLCHDPESVDVEGSTNSNSFGERRHHKIARGDYSRLPPHVKVDLLEFAMAREQKGGPDIDWPQPSVTWC